MNNKKTLLFVLNSLEQTFILKKIKMLSKRGYNCYVLVERDHNPFHFKNSNIKVYNSWKKYDVVSILKILGHIFLNPFVIASSFYKSITNEYDVLQSLKISIKTLPFF